MADAEGTPHIRQPSLLTTLLFALAILGAIGISRAFVIEQIAILWPANGIALGFLLAFERRHWPRLLLAYALAYAIGTTFFDKQPIAARAGFLAANLVEIVPPALLLHRWIARRGGILAVRTVVGLVMIGAGLGPIAGATLAAGVLVLMAPELATLQAWLAWALGNGASTALIALPTYMLLDPRGEFARTAPPSHRSRHVALETVAVALVGMGLVYGLCCAGIDWGRNIQPNYLLFPLVVWAALRLPVRTLVVLVPALGMAACTGVAYGEGFGTTSKAGLDVRALVDLHGYLIVLALTAYTTAVLREQRAQAMREVTEANVRLREAEAAASQRAELLLNATNEGIYGLDAQGRTTFANPAAKRMLGFTAGEMFERDRHALHTHTYPDGTPYPPESCPVYGVLEEGKPRQASDTFFWCKDGTALPVAYRSDPVYDAGGNITGAVVVFRDISTYKEAQARLHFSESRFRAIFDHAPLGIALLGPTGRIRTANRTLALTGGYTPNELEGMRFDRVAHDDDLVDGRSVFDRVLAGSPGPHVQESQFLRADGSVLHARIHLARLAPAAIEGDECLVALIEDVTARKHMEDALRSEQAFSDYIVSCAPHLVVTLDSQGNTRFMNAAAEQATGYTSDELLGRNWWETLFPDNEYDQVRRLIARWGLHGDPVDYPVTITRRDGERRVIAWTAHSRMDPDGNVLETIGYGRDITAEHVYQARQQQQDKLRALGEMAGGMAHEINNALQPILGMAGMLGERVAEHDQKLAGQIAVLENHALHARNIVSDVLAFARNEGPETANHDIVELLDDVADAVARLTPQRITLARRGFPPETPAVPRGICVRVSRNGMLQVLQNLVTNAVDAMAEQGTVTIELSADDDRSGQGERPTQVTVAVADDGPGMDHVTKAELFNPFYTTKPVGQGTGLGLSVVYGLVSGWGGDVVVDSTPGEGTTVTLVLPTTTANAPEPADAIAG